MTALKVIGIIVLLLLLIAQIRVGAEVRFGKELAVKLRIGPVRKTIVPKDEKPSGKQKEAKEKDETAEKKPQKKRSLPKPTFHELTDLVSTAFSALGAMLRSVCRRLRIDPLEIFVTFGGADPADIAQTYGYASAAMWTLMPRAEALFNIPHPSLHLRMDYNTEKTHAEGTVGLSVRIGDIFAIVFALAIPLLKWFLRFKKAHRNDAPPTHKGADAAGEEQEDDNTQEQTEKLSA